MKHPSQLSSQLISLALVSLVAFTYMPVTVRAFPSGAPDSACKEMKPGHGVEASTGTSPFELTQDKLQVEAGDQIKGNIE